MHSINVCEWVSGNKLYCKVLWVVIKTEKGSINTDRLPFIWITNNVNLYWTLFWVYRNTMLMSVTVLHSPIHTHIHTVHLLAALCCSMRGNSGFSILPKDTSACRWGRLGMNCRPSGWRTTALPLSHSRPITIIINVHLTVALLHKWKLVGRKCSIKGFSTDNALRLLF